MASVPMITLLPRSTGEEESHYRNRQRRHAQRQIKKFREQGITGPLTPEARVASKTKSRRELIRELDRIKQIDFGPEHKYNRRRSTRATAYNGIDDREPTLAELRKVLAMSPQERAEAAYRAARADLRGDKETEETSWSILWYH